MQRIFNRFWSTIECRIKQTLSTNVFLGVADDECKKISYGISYGKSYKGT